MLLFKIPSVFYILYLCLEDKCSVNMVSLNKIVELFLAGKKKHFTLLQF